MPTNARTRVSLIWRSAVALTLLAVLTLVVALTAILVSGGATMLAVLAGVWILELTVLPVVLGDQFVVLERVLATLPESVVVAGAVAFPVLYFGSVRDAIRDFRAELRPSGTPAEQRHPEVARTVRRLARQVDVPEPDVYIANRRRPESYALGGRSDGSIAITRGLVRELSDEELRAVLAHEISHLANGDSRVMTLALAPMVLAERVGDETPPSRRHLVREPLSYSVRLVLWAFVAAVTRIQRLCCQFGICVLSRGREYAADRSAAKLTGSPSALASALRTLDDRRGTPSEDKRTWAETASALDVLPHDESRASDGPFRTHPPVDRRIERLERLTVETSTGDD